MTIAFRSSPFAAIAAAIRLQVSWALRINPQYIRITASDDYRITELEDLFVFIRIYGVKPQGDSGEGRLGMTVNRRIRCYIYTRSGTDDYGGDEFSLLTETPTKTPIDVQNTYGSDNPVKVGQLLAEELVYNCLANFLPRVGNQSSGALLTIEPLHPMANEGPPQRKPIDEEGLLRSSLDFDINYILSVTTTEPAPQASNPNS